MSRYPNLLFTLLLIASLAFLALLYGVTKQSEIDERRIENQVTGEQVQLRLAACVQSRVDLVERLASLNWQSSRQLNETWVSQASILFPILPGIQALNFVGPNWVIRSIYPEESNLSALGRNLALNKNASVRASLPLAESTSQIVRTDIIELLQSGKGFALYKKIVGPENQTLGYVNGVFRAQDLIETCLAEKQLKKNFRFAITELDGSQVYAQSDSPPPWQEQVTLPVDVAGRDWTLVFGPSALMLENRPQAFTEILFLVGIMLILSIYFVIFRLIKQRASLHESQEIYRLLVENQSDMVVKVNMDNKFLYVSPSYCEAFGKSETELLNQAFMPLVHEDDRGHTEASLSSLVHPPHRSYHEQRAMTKSGWRWLAWSNQGVLDASGNLEAITAVGRDVTEVKALEERMTHAEKMNAIGEMAGGITHDFNNLLQVMLGNLEFLIEQPDLAKGSSPLLVGIRNAVERAMQLTKKLSGLSRQQTPQRQVINVNELLDDLMGLLRRAIPQTIKLELKVSDPDLFVRADPTQLEQVVLNLCFNARDAIGARGIISLTVSAVELDAAFCRLRPGMLPGPHVCLEVKDDGEGMDEEKLSKVFDPYYTTKSIGEGTGLGLTNCYYIIEQHNGVITASSKLFEGTSFCVYLPALPADSMAENDDNALKQKEDQHAEGGIILVADDNQDVRRVACAQLQMAGYQTIEAENGESAVNIFREHQQDIRLVILDVVMPILDGKIAAGEIRKIQPDASICFISGYSPETMADDEMNGPLLKKPFKAAELRDMVKKMLEVE